LKKERGKQMLKKGDKVEIKRGELKGLQGVVQHFKEKNFMGSKIYSEVKIKIASGQIVDCVLGDLGKIK
jgi:ribosomal protein L24